MTEDEARDVGWKAGQRSMKRHKRLSWTMDDAAEAVVAYRKATGAPNATLEAAKSTLTLLTKSGAADNHSNSALTPARKRSKGKTPK